MNDHAAVIDASFFLGAFLSEFCSDEEKKARDYISKIIQNNGQIYVPQLFWFEIGNVLTNAVKPKKDGSAGRLSLPQFLTVYQNIRELPIYTDPQPDSETQLRISNLAVQYNLTFYDASYLELAIRTSLPLKTFDRKLLQYYNQDYIAKLEKSIKQTKTGFAAEKRLDELREMEK
ncbi:MAG: type II toxin-antitoxin system VapC family toxin [Spirochaetia bacterium]|nr:type II toxin-antitoxin system VapC family toxin [Spirochaetia bacterium]